MKKKKGTKTSKSEVLTLPTEKSVPSDNLWDYLILLYGTKKIGKTSMLQHAGEAPFYCMFEPGGKAIGIYQRPVTSWLMFRKIIDLLEKDAAGENKFNPVIIDTVDVAYDCCQERMCFELGIDHPSDLGYAKGWHAVKREFVRQIARLAATGKGIAFVSHNAEKEIKARGGTYDMVAPTMTGSARDVMDKIIDIWVHYDFFGEERWLQILGDDHVQAGHRLETRFKYPDGSPIRYLQCGDSSQETWDNFTAAFDNELDRPDTLPSRTKKKKKKKKRKITRSE